MYDYANGMLFLHVQTETTCIPFVYNKNKLKNYLKWKKNWEKVVSLFKNSEQYNIQLAIVTSIKTGHSKF